MIITTDLRAAIRSAEKQQRLNRHSRYASETAALERFQKLPKIAPLFKQAAAKHKAATVLTEQADAIYSSMGLTTSGRSIIDHKKFAQLGGRLEVEEGKPWTFDAVMVELAAADAKKAKAILKRLGINWA